MAVSNLHWWTSKQTKCEHLQKEPEIALYVSTLALEQMSSGQLISEKTQELQNSFRDRWQRKRSIGKTFRDWDCLIERGNRREMKNVQRKQA